MRANVSTTSRTLRVRIAIGISSPRRWPSRSAQPSASVACAMAVALVPEQDRLGARARPPASSVLELLEDRHPLGQADLRPHRVEVQHRLGERAVQVEDHRARCAAPRHSAAASGAPPGARDVLVLDLADVHAARPLGHRRQQLLDRRRLALDEAQRVDARDDEVAQVRAVEPARLQRRHRVRHGLVDVEQQRRRARAASARAAASFPAASGRPCAGSEW